MKKVILSIAVFAASVQMSNAQTATIGVQAGASLNILSYDGESENGMGYTVGVTSFFPMGGKWGFRPEINYQNRRYVSTDSYSDHNYEFSSESTESYSYLDIPLLFQYNGGPGFGFFVGPQFGTALTGNQKYSYHEKYTYPDGTVSEMNDSGQDKILSFGDISEVSIVLGPTYTFNNGLAVELRAQRTIGILGFGDFSTELAWTVVQVGARYSIPMGK